MADLLELAERCEAAETDSFDLNHAIALALGIPSEPYTASLDAALTLVPDGHTWTIYADGIAGVCPKLDEDDLADGDVWAATPALALCAAALRARNEQ